MTQAQRFGFAFDTIRLSFCVLPSRRSLLRLVAFASFIFVPVTVASAQPDISGVWTADDGGTYYVRQFQNVVWWLGWSPASPNDFHKGIGFANVFRGVVAGNAISGEWADVPRGQTLSAGTLRIGILSPTDMSRQSETGGFSGSRWHKSSTVAPAERNIFDTFDLVKKNQNAWRDHSLLDNLKPAKRFATITGNVVPDLTPDRNVHLNYPAAASRSYSDFICLNNNDSPPDGDLNITIAVDRPKLDTQAGFWNTGWQIWDDSNPGGTSDILRAKIYRYNEIHGESIMYGRTVECNDGNYDAPPLLPGWQEFDSNSLLVNGIPVNGRLGATQRDSSSMNVFSLLNEPVGPGTRVRLVGALVLDCGHGILRNCNEEDTTDQNQEIHPVYAIDLLQDFSLPRPGADLTGVWMSSDVGAYYLRQLGNTIWWLGLSQDDGRTFANVFRGTIQGNSIRGEWTDVPLYASGSSNNGTLNLVHSGPTSLVLDRLNQTGNFGAQMWEKLYDLKFTITTLTFESATTTAFGVVGGEFTGSGFVEGVEFEISLNGKTSHAVPQNQRLAALGAGVRGTQADLGLRIELQTRSSVSLYLVARYQGWRLVSSSLDRPSDFSPGVHTLRLTPPTNGPLPQPPSGGFSGPRVKPPYDRDADNTPLPTISITYRVDVTNVGDLGIPPPPRP